MNLFLNLLMIQGNSDKQYEVRDAMGAFSRGAKRLFDVVASAFCLLLVSPVFFCIWLVLFCQKQRPVIYTQERVGYKGKLFIIYKFRTMEVGRENDGVPRLADGNDRQVTRIGRFLRQHHLDELPQLWNVLRGDMSFVGPRPERPFFVKQIMEHDARYELLYQLRPGITSEATLYNGYTYSMEKMLKRLDMDLDYLSRRSLWLDACILLKTFISIITGKIF